MGTRSPLWTYDDIRKQLEGLEAQFPKQQPAAGVAEWVSARSDPVQVFALENRTKSRRLPLPVVVVIGANYTQDPSRTPRDEGWPRVEDSAGSCRANLERAVRKYLENPSAWRDTGNASPQPIELPPDYHLVLTNLCGWITRTQWSDIPDSTRRLLLLNAPALAGVPSASSYCPHLTALQQALSPGPSLWVAHGITAAEIFERFDRWRISAGVLNWLRTPGLSRPYQSYGKCFPRSL